jgi:phosphatidyl-myo-inositol dimannoside synthase
VPDLHRHLLLTYDFPPMTGGIARMMGEVARRYPGESLTVSTGSHPGSAATDGAIGRPVQRSRVPSGRLRTLQGLLTWTREAVALERAISPSFVWCGNFKPATYPARWLRWRSGVPYGTVLHGSELLLLADRLDRLVHKRVIARVLLGSAAVLVANSRWTRDLALRVLGELDLDPDRLEIRIVLLGTDPRVFRPGVETRDVRARYGLGEGRWLFTIARLAAHKGIDTALQVVAALAPEFPDLRYAIVGSGVRHRQLDRLAHELGVGDRVRFLTAVPDADLPALLNCAEIYLGLSRTVELMAEGFGIAITEASACGVPVVAGASGGIPDAVRHGETGLLVDSTGPGPAIEAVRLLLGDAELARKLGAGGRAAAESFYNWDRVATEMHELGIEFGGRPGPARTGTPPPEPAVD